MKLPVQIRRNGSLPLLRIERFDRSSRACNAGVVDQHVQSAQLTFGHSNDFIDLMRIAHVRNAAMQKRTRRYESLDGIRIDIANHDMRICLNERFGNRRAVVHFARPMPSV